MSQLKDKLGKLKEFKVPLLILALGVLLMLFPGSGGTEETAEDAGNPLQQALACSQGVGEVRVILSENGVVVVCDGAENAKVRLDIIRAVSAYTGFGSDRITILRMADRAESGAG